jgi:hemerythrin-like domain-containing protein
MLSAPGQYQTDVSDMYAVHQGILKALDAAPQLVTGAVGNDARVDAVASFYDNVLEFLHVHHQGEDELIYPRLEQRCTPDDEMLERIDAQHKLLYGPMDEAWELVDAFRHAPSNDSAAAVIAALSKVDEVLRPHLGEEETHVLPLATKWLSPDEWAELPGHAMMSFRKDKPWLALGLVREGLTQEQRDAMLAGMPAPVAQMWTNEWESAFNSFIAQVRS